MGRAPRRHGDVAAPCPQHGQSQVRRCAEAEQPHAFAALDTSHAQAAESDDAGAQQGSDFEIAQSGGQGNREIFARHGVLGVSAVDGVPGEGRRVAQIFLAPKAVLAGSIDAGHPRYAKAMPPGFAYDLMARNHAIAKRLQLAFDDVQVGAAHAAGADPQQDLARRRRGNRNIEDFEGVRRDARRTRQNRRLHHGIRAFF